MSVFPETPTVVAIDLQKEYVTPGRPFFLRGVEPSLDNCRAIIAEARRRGWGLAHVRHIQDGSLFNAETPFAGFIDGCGPLPTERVFTKAKLSCYSTPGFGRLMTKLKGRTIYVIGYGSTMCCLSTLVEAHHRGHRLTFVADASYARPSKDALEAEVHKHATNVIGIYANLATTHEVLGRALRDAA
jgi:ureidoacrylate peracid hydrolase